MTKKRAKKKTVAKATPKERAEAKRLPATTKFLDRIKKRVTAAVINMAFLTLLIEFLMAAFESSEPDAARIARRLAHPNPWHRGRMVRETFLDADGDLTRREARQMVAGVIYEARKNPTDTAKMVQEGLDEIKRLKALKAVA